MLPIERTAKTLIRPGGCRGIHESSLGAHAVLLVLSCAGSLKNIICAMVKYKETFNGRHTVLYKTSSCKLLYLSPHPRSPDSQFLVFSRSLSPGFIEGTLTSACL